MRNSKGQFVKGIQPHNRTHGLSGSRFHRIYQGIKNRCGNPNVPAFSEYGGRGIKNTWGSFNAFKGDMYTSYLSHIQEFGEKNTTIDRIDNNGNYSKENCRWASIKEQMSNKRSNVKYEFKGKMCSLQEIGEVLGIHWKTLWRRINASGWSHEDAFSKPLR